MSPVPAGPEEQHRHLCPPCHRHPVSPPSHLGSGGPQLLGALLLAWACPLPITVTWARSEPSKASAGTSRETSSVAVGMEGSDSRDAPAPPGLAPHHLCPTPFLLRPSMDSEQHLSWELLETLVPGSSGPVAKHPCPVCLWHCQPPRLVLPSWQSRELCAFSTRIPPGCREAAAELVRRKHQPHPPAAPAPGWVCPTPDPPTAPQGLLRSRTHPTLLLHA